VREPCPPPHLPNLQASKAESGCSALGLEIIPVLVPGLSSPQVVREVLQLVADCFARSLARSLSLSRLRSLASLALFLSSLDHSHEQHAMSLPRGRLEQEASQPCPSTRHTPPVFQRLRLEPEASQPCSSRQHRLTCWHVLHTASPRPLLAFYAPAPPARHPASSISGRWKRQPVSCCFQTRNPDPINRRAARRSAAGSREGGWCQG